MSALEAIQGTHDSFTPDDLYAHFRSFEEKLRQSGDLKQTSKSKTVAFPAQNRNLSSSSNTRLSNDQFINKIDHETSKDAFLLSKMFQGMLDFERKYNKNREEKNKRVMCFACHREGHTIQTCFKLFPQLKNEEGERQQDRKPRQKYDGYKKKKAKAMQALFSEGSEDEQTDTESENEGEANLALMAIVDEGSSTIDMDSIIASKNITDETTIQFLLDLAKSRSSKKVDEGEIEASTSSANEVHSNSCFNGYETELEVIGEGGEEYDGEIDPENCIITNETNNDLYTNRLKTNDTSTFTNEVLIHYDDESRLQSRLDESNRTLIEKEGIIQQWIHKHDMLELEIKRLKASHLGEIGILNVKLKNLEIENGALRSTSEVSNVTSLDPYYVDKLINSHKMDRIGLGFEKGKSSFESIHNRGPKEKGEHSQTSNTKFKFNGEQYSNYQFFTKKGLTPLKKELPKMKSSHISNAKLDKKSPNHAFRYKYNNRDYKNKKKFQSNDRNTFNPKGSNKTYFKGPDGWFYEIKNKNALQNQTQRYGLARDVPQHHNRIDTYKTKSVTSTIAHKSHLRHKNSVHEVRYQPIFNQGSTTQRKSTTMCNYCCHLGHTSLECRFRNANNKQNVVWVPKATLA